ncbi:MAG: PAS domain S-box protein, partial [Acidobacteria bacterium]|nr:PAS domain S-box protein [Acidobacteriota bacterium]
MHPPRTNPQPDGRAAYVAAGLLTVAAVAFTAWTLFVNERQALRDAAREQLTAVARLKTVEVSAWMTERLADATVLSESVYAVQPPDSAGDARLEDVRRVLENAVRVYRYEAAELLDGTGRQLLAAGSPAPHPAARVAALRARASSTTSAVMSDLYTDGAGGVHLDVAVALHARGGMVPGFLVLHLDPRERLLPAVERWPVPSETAESLIVRREEGNVLFLSPLRHRTDPPLTFRVPLSRPEVVAVQAVSGHLGIVEGVDYRGVPVLCAVESVPSTGWVLIAKMDREEIDAPLRQRAWLLSVAGSALALLAAGVVARSWRRRLRALDREDDAKRRHLVSAIEQSADAIVLTDLNSTITYVNPAFERITGYTAQEAIGQNPRLLKSGRHDDAFYRDLYATLLRGETFRGVMINRRKDGSLFEEEATMSPVRDPDGQVTGFVAVKRDVTRERALEERLRQSSKVEAVGLLAGGVAHDFNNLLTVISGFSALAKDQLPEGHPAAGHLDEVLTAAARAASLTQQLLAFSRKQVLRPEVVDLDAVVTESVRLLKRLIGEDIRVVPILAGNLPPVLVDQAQMQQVVLNLAVNARDAMPNGGTLTIETESVVLDEAYAAAHDSTRSGPFVRLTISDTGSGIPQELQSKVFDPFFTTKEKGKGTGLGLSTVYGIVKQSGGWIWLYSESGKGSTFKIFLPPAAGDAPVGG